MHYFVDGYNLLFKFPKQHIALEKRRQAIISWMNSVAKELKLTVTLVFDATLQEEKRDIVRSHYDAVEIVYTEAQDADSYILEEIEYRERPTQVIVVTSDKELAQRARLLGANTLNIKSFIAQLVKKKAKRELSSKEATIFKDSEKNILRLLKIFEERDKP